ncbi:major facilitator super transporter protein [Actinomortierella ambigua]|nr:major facilitator super transporter protein [Actinomortierella ambigua]
MKPLSVYGILLASITCQLVGMLMFAKGFFPYKPISTSFASHDDLPALPLQSAGPAASGSAPPIPPRFGRLVLMLVDALRSLIDHHKALPFTALASAPTVTLPRLKALTTGTVPGFLDAVLNIAESDQSSTLANQDSWVAQWTRSPSRRDPSQNRTIGFFGDDTWIKLFPGQFFRSDGTSSFFAMDTVEVDLNVTRHVEPELAKNDWDALIFHYLGLDHVGHSGGPKSPLMQPKQAEMDDVARQIYRAVSMQDAQLKEGELPTLFILCGDHGMNEVGNHGGSSKSEVSTAFLFASPLFESWGKTAIHKMIDPHRQRNQPEDFQYYKMVNQVDLVPTLSLLMGNPIPKNSVGKLIPELFHGYSKHDTLRALQVNAHQVAHVLKGMWPSFETEADRILDTWNDSDTESDSAICQGLKSDREELSCLYSNALARHTSFLEMTMPSRLGIEYKTVDQVMAYEAAYETYSKFLSNASSMLSTALSKYDMALLTNGSLLMGFAVAGFLYLVMQSQTMDDLKASCRSPATSPVSRDSRLPWPRSLEQAIQTLMTMSTESKGIEYGRVKTKQRAMVLDQWTATEVNWILPRILTVVVLVLYLVTLFASSFVEEEHQFWYFFVMTWWVALALTSGKYIYETRGTIRRPSAKAVLLCLAQMAVLRLMRAWNQTGQKYADEIDIRFYLNATLKPLSWFLFFLSIVVVAVTMIWSVIHRQYNSSEATIQNRPTKHGTAVIAGPKSLRVVLQSLIILAILSVSCWVTAYKMDLEASFFGHEAIDRMKRLLWIVRPLAVYTSSEEGREMTGFEMARWSYAGLAFIVFASFILAKLDRYAALLMLPTDGSVGAQRSMFLPTMIQGSWTLLAILLSRRHNAPLFVLFGLQLWLYLQWTKLVRVDTTYKDNAVSQQNPLLVEDESTGYMPAAPVQQSLQASANASMARYRSLPGLYSIHSTSVILWTMSSFFLLGNSNSIASIDIGNAYVGIRSYDIFLTGVLTFVSNWSGPLWWALAGTLLVVTGQDVEHEGQWLLQDATLRVAVEDESRWRSVSGWRKAKQVETKRTRKRKVARDGLVRDLKRQQKADRQKLVATNEASLALESNSRILVEPVNNVSDLAEIIAPLTSHVSVTEEEPMGEGPVVEAETEELNEAIIDPLDMRSDSELYGQEELSPRWICENPIRFQGRLMQQRLVDHLVWTSTFLGLVLYALSIAAIILRHHLFIWTVFSPKVLYQMAWTVLYQTVAQVTIIPAIAILAS